MSDAATDGDLERRLERLAREDPACHLPQIRERARQIREREAVEHALGTAKALSNENRMTVLCLLVEEGELCACQVQAALGVTHATVNHHMGVLGDAGLVESDRRGAWVYYEPTDRARETLSGWSG